MIVLGITGSIGVGKTETARMLQRLGASVSYSDEIVSGLYEQVSIQKQISMILPQDFGPITRSKVAVYITHHPEILKDLEKILHPAVKAVHLQDIDEARQKNQTLTVLDIPLLFESGWQNLCDYTALVTCQPQIQLRRVMSRPRMTLEKFQKLMDRQWPLDQKRSLADFVLDTDLGRVHTFQQLKYLLKHHCRK